MENIDFIRYRISYFIVKENKHLLKNKHWFMVNKCDEFENMKNILGTNKSLN